MNYPRDFHVQLRDDAVRRWMANQIIEQGPAVEAPITITIHEEEMNYYLVSGSDPSSDGGHWGMVIRAPGKQRAEALARSKLRQWGYAHLAEDMEVERLDVKKDGIDLVYTYGMNGRES